MIWRSRGTSLKSQMIMVMFDFQFLGMNLLSTFLYFVENAADLNEFIYLLLKSC